MNHPHLDTIHNIQMLRAIAALLVVLHHFYPHYQAMGGTLSPVTTLSAWGFVGFELYFYFLFLFTFLISKEQLYWILPIFIALLFFAILYIHFHPQIPQSFFYSPFLLEFFGGVALYMYRAYLMKIWIFVLGILIAIFAYRYGAELDARNGLLRVAAFGTGAFFVVLCALIAEKRAIYSAGKSMEAIGNASFSIYLSHIFFIQLFYTFGLRDLFSSTHEFMPFAGLLLVVSSIILFSLFYYQNVEKPIYQKAIGEHKR